MFLIVFTITIALTVSNRIVTLNHQPATPVTKQDF